MATQGNIRPGPPRLVRRLLLLALLAGLAIWLWGERADVLEHPASAGGQPPDPGSFGAMSSGLGLAPRPAIPNRDTAAEDDSAAGIRFPTERVATEGAC